MRRPGHVGSGWAAWWECRGWKERLCGWMAAEPSVGERGWGDSGGLKSERLNVFFEEKMLKGEGRKR